nr:MAG TPA: hypothetical protein [Caudoviricetes sp.]
MTALPFTQYSGFANVPIASGSSTSSHANPAAEEYIGFHLYPTFGSNVGAGASAIDSRIKSIFFSLVSGSILLSCFRIASCISAISSAVISRITPFMYVLTITSRKQQAFRLRSYLSYHL